MSGFRSSACFWRRRPRLPVSAGSASAGVRLGRVDVLDQLDPLPLDVAVEVLDVGLVEVDLGHRGGDVAEGEHAELLTLGDQALYLFKLLKFCYQHLFPIRSLALCGLAASSRG